MSLTVTRPLMIVLGAFLLVVGLGGAGIAAEPPVSDATQQKIDQLGKLLIDPKIDQLGKLLGDPDIRSVLAEHSGQTPTDDIIPGASAGDFTGWFNAIQDHLTSVVAAVPLLPSEFRRARETTMTQLDNRRPIVVLVFFLLLVAIGRAAEYLFEGIGRRIHAHRLVDSSHPSANGFHILGRHFFAEIAPLVAFSLASLGLFLTMSWPRLLTQLIMPTLLGLIVGRFLIRIARLLLTVYPNASGEGTTRLIPIGEDAAHFWFRRVAIFISVFIFAWAANGIMLELGFVQAAREAVVYSLGLVLLAVEIEMVWRRPREADHSQHHGAFDWLLVFWLCLIWILWVAGANLLMWICAYVLLVPIGLKVLTSATHSAFLRSEHMPGTRSPVLEVIIERSERAIFIGLAVLWLVTIIRANSTMMVENETASRILRGTLSGIVVLLVADMLWQMVKALIEHRLAQARAAEGDPAEAAEHGRLLTLLPILKNFIAVLIGVIAILTVLSGLGVAIGPLIAGAGIFGVAIGFGSQTLVKDVISGVFYMMDDAFRVGEYIQSGSYKGTVESFSIRSVRLRHHRGPVYTVPFGVLGAVENLSRDWAIDKFKIAVAFDTDLAKVKKLVKGIGATLLEDPELGPHILETVKLKGIEEFGDYGITISFTMTTKPGFQSGIRRRAHAMIREVFTNNGIEFASPTVQIAGEERKTGTDVPNGTGIATASTASVVAGNAIAMRKPPAAEVG